MSDKGHQLSFGEYSSDSGWAQIFSDSFLPKLVGSIMIDPHFAIVELIANCWDAGASKVFIEWPSRIGDCFSISDDGTSMTKPEFRRRWMDLAYDRISEQGEDVEFPRKKKKKRKAYGRNGVGRHAMFCFSDEYFIEIKKDGKLSVASVKRTTGRKCFDIEIIQDEAPTSEHGTRIWCEASKNISLDSKEVAEFVGSRFVADPEFETYVNNQLLSFEDLGAFSKEIVAELSGGQEISIKRFDSEKTGRTSKQNGIAYWVENRLVGMPTWEGFDGSLIDARHKEAKRYTYVVDANILGTQSVKKDWSNFHPSALVNEVRKKVSIAVKDDLIGLTKDLRERNKNAALKANRGKIARLPLLSREQINRFADEIQVACPNMNARDLENAIAVLTKLEEAKTGYSLLERLSTMDPSDIDGLYAIVSEWSVNDAKKVLEEINWRIRLVVQLEKLVNVPTTDELHQLQPLFDKGLWILGYEYDSIDFSSNRTLSTVLKNMFDEADVSGLRNRPDFVVKPRESSFSVHSRKDIIEPGSKKLGGLQSVVILELKKPYIAISDSQIDQARGYAREIRKHVPPKTAINCYVLGTSVDDHISRDNNKEGNISIYPTEYELILDQAKRRLFDLRDQIEIVDDNDRQGDIFNAAG
jgi:hypothetical protein